LLAPEIIHVEQQQQLQQMPIVIALCAHLLTRFLSLQKSNTPQVCR